MRLSPRPRQVALAVAFLLGSWHEIQRLFGL